MGARILPRGCRSESRIFLDLLIRSLIQPLTKRWILFFLLVMPTRIALRHPHISVNGENVSFAYPRQVSPQYYWLAITIYLLRWEELIQSRNSRLLKYPIFMWQPNPVF